MYSQSVFFRALGGLLDCTFANWERPDWPFSLCRQTRKSPGPSRLAFAGRLVEVELGEDAAAHFHQLVVERRIAVELDAPVAVDASRLPAVPGPCVPAEKEKGLLSVTPICRQRTSVFSSPSSIFERTAPVNRAVLPSKCILLSQLTSKGVVRSRPSRLGRLFDGKLQSSRPVDVGRVLRAVEDDAASFDVGPPVADVPRLAVDDHHLIRRSAVLHLEHVAVDRERLGPVSLRLGEVHAPLGNHVGHLRRHVGTSADDADSRSRPPS